MFSLAGAITVLHSVKRMMNSFFVIYWDHTKVEELL